MTQLGELRDAYAKFQAAGIKLYAISYDDRAALAAFSEAQMIPFPLLSDVDSKVIEEYGILNTELGSGQAMLRGIPFPGTYVTDENGVVVEKFFHDTYKKRDSPEMLLESALGEILLGPDDPRSDGGDDDVKVTAVLHGGRGSLRQGIRRSLVVRFELADGLHIYGEPVPDGMVPTSVSVTGPEGIVFEEAIVPATEPLRLESLDLELPVWSGTVDFRIPLYATSIFASECRPLDRDTAALEVNVRYQACDDRACLLPKTETLRLEVPVEPVDVQTISLHVGHGQSEGFADAGKHLRRLVLRKVRARPLDFVRFILRNLRLEREGRRRLRS